MSLDTVNALDTLANIKTHLKIDAATYDTQLETIIDGVSWLFNSFTGRDLIARDRTDYYDGPPGGGEFLYLHHWPIVTLTTVNVDTDRAFSAGDDIATGDRYFSKDEGWIGLDAGFPDGVRRSIKVVSNAGWAIANLPLEIVLAFRDQVKTHYRRWVENDEAHKTVTRESTSVTYEDGYLLDHVKAILFDYKRKGITGGMTT